MSLRGTQQSLRPHPPLPGRKGLRSLSANWLLRFRGGFLIAFCILSFTQNSFCQITYDNRVYKPSIKTVEFYNTAKEGAFPVIGLGSNEQVLLAFDELGSNTRTYNYTIEHCDAEW